MCGSAGGALPPSVRTLECGDCFSIEGEHCSRQRTETIARFQREPSRRLIIVSIPAGGTGVTLTAAADLAVLEPEWTPPAQSQAGDRLARRGQTNPVQPYYLYLGALLTRP
ncbi:MAG: C-terminal helicase domain-containing protein [Actinomycetota bacterium]|nr:C-terminal helicase domain-containing protein [Actinomycetota bacterium]